MAVVSWDEYTQYGEQNSKGKGVLKIQGKKAAEMKIMQFELS